MIVEDVKATTKGQRRWDKSFSPLQVGKTWFYEQIDNLILKRGWETKQLRDSLGLKKTSNKLSKSFDAHCVDSWVLANFVVGGHVVPDNKRILYLRPLRFHRRQLHVLNPTENGYRRPYGGTMSMGLKRGSLIKHTKRGLTCVGGTSDNKISLHSLDGKRIGQSFKVKDCRLLTYCGWTFNLKGE